jgi:hypothetical protein
MEFDLAFSFGLGAGCARCKVLHVSAPVEDDLITWTGDAGETVTFYPFLVVLAGTDKEGRSLWLPYWHTVEKDGSTERKYGQWAPFIDDFLFKSLVEQARASGFL